MISVSPRRHWYQFRLRTFFVLVTLVCIGFGWWVQRSKEWIRRRHNLKSFQMNVGQVRAPGGLWIFGEEGVGEIFVHPPQCDEAESLFPEAKFSHHRWKK